jgi:hypothetical protein
MNNTYTIGSRDTIKQPFTRIHGLPLMTRTQAEKALELATKKSEFFELAIINTAS